ncbi:MAG: spermidine synthase [Alphaproteobacteria bacterium]
MNRTTPKPPAATGKSQRRALLLWAVPSIVILSAAAFAAIYAFSPAVETVAANAQDATPPVGETRLVTRVESLYNDIYLYRRGDGNFMLSFGARRLRYVESVVNPDDELDLPVYYTQSMTAGLAFPENLDSAAIIGLGGGRTAWYLHKSIPELRFTAVELDPEVARIADRYFGVREEDNFVLDIRDGRVHLSNSEDRFDMILVDAYRGPFVPFHLLTRQFYELVGKRLRPGGVVVQNVEPSTMLFDSAVATIQSAFDNLAFFSGRGNIVIVAYNGPPLDEATIRERARERQARFGFRYDLSEIIERRFEPAWDATTEPLTDDWAPVEYLKAVQRHNRRQT